MSVAFLWHMHQPDYRDAQGRFFMPWVFLHAIKDYYDMPWILSHFDVQVTFNLTPILIEQLQEYIDQGPSCDYFLDLLLRPCDQLEEKDKNFIQKICKTAHYETMVRPIPRFAELYHKSKYSDEELGDLEVCFLLAWCGNYLREDEEIAKLLQERRFSQEQKETLVKKLFDFLPTILPLYRSLYQKGQIALSTTPYTHPILPLLLDISVAKEANPATILPKDGIKMKEDARLHIERALQIFEHHFGQKPRGFWPAEGAVDEKSVQLYQEYGIEWIATDEAILYKSGGQDPTKTYQFNGVRIFFRNHTLSDLIGFTYRFYDPDQAVEDFVGRLPGKGIAFVILDGENAWEHYPQNGLPFLKKLYSRLATYGTLNFDEAAKKRAKKLSHLAPGSWIYGDFNTWVGDEEKNRAWELLFQTKRDIIHHPTQDPDITRHFLAAEASDWFWWYGRGHYTEFAKEFDELFRAHLVRIYELAGLAVPKDLLIPILGAHTIQAVLNEPTEYIYPIIDGRVSSFFEWLGSGYLDEGGDTMQANMAVRRLFWGENEQNIFFRLDSDMAKELDVQIFFDESRITPTKMAKDEIIEIAIEKKELPKEFEVRIEIYKAGKIIQILPSSTRLFITIGGEYAKNWFV